MKKVGILGGTFDPPHNGHLLMAYEVLHALSLDEIWFMPTQIPPHKELTYVSKSSDRLSMLRLALDGHARFKIQPIELEREGLSFSFDTIELLKNRYTCDFYFIIGGDMIEYLPNWYKIDELVSMISFVGVDRTGFSRKSEYPVLMVEAPLFDVSSTLIRERLKTKGNTELLISKSVLNYIQENSLYE